MTRSAAGGQGLVHAIGSEQSARGLPPHVQENRIVLACSALVPATPEALLRLMLDQEPFLGVLERQERKLDLLREGRRLQPADLFTQCIDVLPWHDRVSTSLADPL
jgi:hypothetical protein